jgi:hypothetical protein
LVCNATADNCSYTYCNVNYTEILQNGKRLTNPCIVVNRCAISALVIGLTTGAVVGIIVAAILAGAMIGGGTYAAATTFAAEPTNDIQNNPLYQPQGLDAQNPLYGDQENAP